MDVGLSLLVALVAAVGFVASVIALRRGNRAWWLKASVVVSALLHLLAISYILLAMTLLTAID